MAAASGQVPQSSFDAAIALGQEPQSSLDTVVVTAGLAEASILALGAVMLLAAMAMPTRATAAMAGARIFFMVLSTILSELGGGPWSSNYFHFFKAAAGAVDSQGKSLLPKCPFLAVGR